MEAQEIIDTLTNGVGEKPYCRREDGLMKVFVADDQLFCTIASMGDNKHLEEPAARAICEAGLKLKALVDAVEAAEADSANTIHQLEDSGSLRITAVSIALDNARNTQAVAKEVLKG